MVLLLQAIALELRSVLVSNISQAIMQIVSPAETAVKVGVGLVKENVLSQVSGEVAVQSFFTVKDEVQPILFCMVC